MHSRLSNKTSKLIKSLQQKKYRDQFGCFVVEGIKMVEEGLASGWQPEYVVYTGQSEAYSLSLPANALWTDPRSFETISSLKAPQGILAVFKKPVRKGLITSEFPMFALDGVSDPGNLGTIMRISDWFGMPDLICSQHCVDVFNPKVVQASMGSIFRVRVHVVELSSWLAEAASWSDLYGAHMEGQSLYQTSFSKSAVMVLGSEAHGISPDSARFIKQVVRIPRRGGGESLNVAMTAAVMAPWLSGAFTK